MTRLFDQDQVVDFVNIEALLRPALPTEGLYVLLSIRLSVTGKKSDHMAQGQSIGFLWQPQSCTSWSGNPTPLACDNI